jgi:hypothetical protein
VFSSRRRRLCLRRLADVTAGRTPWPTD